MTNAKDDPIILKPDDYGSNSHKSKENAQDRPKAKPQNVKRASPSLRRVFKDVFIAEDVKDVKSYFIFDILIPGVKEAILSVLEMLLLGSISRSAGYSDRHVDYASYSRNKGKRKEKKDKFVLEDIIFRTRGEAEEVLQHLIEDAEQYGQISVGAFKEEIGVSSEYTDHDYGWAYEDIRKSGVSRSRNGFIINFPRVTPLD